MIPTRRKIKWNNIFLFCLRYGGFDSPRFSNQRQAESKFLELVHLGRVKDASYVFSRQNSRASEIFFYLVDKLQLVDNPKEYSDLAICTYCMPSANTSFNQFFKPKDITRIFSRISKPYLSFNDGTILSNDYDLLPDEITVYRGTTKEPEDLETCGFSWTLSLKVARGFAHYNQNKIGYLITGTIAKSAIIAYLTNRGETEIIAYANNIRNKTVSTIHNSAK